MREHWIQRALRVPGAVRRVLRDMKESPDGYVVAASLAGFALAVALQWSTR